MTVIIHYLQINKKRNENNKFELEISKPDIEKSNISFTVD